MSYWLEDANGEWLGDFATNRGIVEIREMGPASVVELLDLGEADEELVEKIVKEVKDIPSLSYIADMLKGADLPAFITDGCGSVGE